MQSANSPPSGHPKVGSRPVQLYFCQQKACDERAKVAEEELVRVPGNGVKRRGQRHETVSIGSQSGIISTAQSAAPKKNGRKP